MFKNWQNTLATAAASGAAKADAKTMSPTLRSDIYSAVDQAKPWLIGGAPGAGTVRHAGDGVSFQPLLATIQKHFPAMSLGLESVGSAEAEVAVIVAGITNMVLEMSKWDGMAGGMAMRTWVDALSEAHARISDAQARGENRKDQVGRGITRGINQLTDVTLMTREFAARIQIISLLKSVNTKVHGAGSEEARQGEALWSSKFI
ncbi:hypothetical protein BU15DRAFT_52094 [Melanogaster broomeanus]|nr:hypothetical protein BU15DRAFT_52094 [Melanogaster broomeanus]